MSSGGGNDSNDGALGDAQAKQEPPAKARGRGKTNRTQLRVPTPEGRVQLKPIGVRKDAWAFLCKYWTSNEYKDKRRAAQASRVKSEDVAQNRGGSRPWGQTQQLLEYKFGPDKAGTLNTYAVMKSAFKKVDNTGRSAPIPSRRAQKRLVKRIDD
ncbi:hypothetical protein E2562_014734 [Oryza meyeriana var. granulata]|uniref:Uncharacterized protein n=1 Tax=Oryza meyeriana var. granulata TaxID=110450 RepID=A0A6G1BL87_9ORYZ|nr:hypothetical protein E2562_014734 [Oryza meyeriana var. granulata]